MWPRITRNWTFTTINHKPNSYCLLLVRSKNYKSDRCCSRLVRSTYYGSHPWCVVLIFSLILHYIEFVYEHCYSRRLRIRLRLYCNITNEDLTLMRDFNIRATVREHVIATQLNLALTNVRINTLIIGEGVYFQFQFLLSHHIRSM